MRRAAAMAIKEVRQVLRDPLTLAMLVALPMAMLVLYGYALNFDVENVALAVQDRDATAASRSLIDAFVSGRRFALVASLPPGADIDGFLDRDGASAVLVIPERYERSLAQGHDAPVQVLIDGVDASSASTVVGYVAGVAASHNGTRVRATLAGSGVTAGGAAIDFRPRVWYNPELLSTQFLGAGHGRLSADVHRGPVDGALRGAREGARNARAASRQAATHRRHPGRQAAPLPVHLACRGGADPARREAPLRRRRAGAVPRPPGGDGAFPHRRARLGPAGLDTGRLAGGGVPDRA